MPILRISAQEIHGIVVDDNERRAMERLSRGGEAMATLVRAAMRDYQIAPEVCLPGIVDITPRYWKRNRAEHILEVLPGGEAAFCHVVPKDHNLAPVPYERVDREVVAQDLTATRSVSIPGEAPIVPVVGQFAGDPRIRVHEIIMHIPQA